MSADSAWLRPTAGTTFRRVLGRFEIYHRLVGVPEEAARRAWREMQADEWLFSRLRDVERKFEATSPAGLGASVRGASLAERALTRFRFSLPNAELYTLVRSLAPTRVVETGVASGISTSIVLRALQRNGTGTLTSVDLPIRSASGSVNADGVRDRTHLPAGERPGWGVPPELRSPWTLIEGDSRVVLHRALDGPDPPTFFFHDSEHSSEVMEFEFRAAWEALAPGGTLYSDDIFWNEAFPTFARAQGFDPHRSATPAGRGLLQKGRSDAPSVGVQPASRK